MIRASSRRLLPIRAPPLRFQPRLARRAGADRLFSDKKQSPDQSAAHKPTHSPYEHVVTIDESFRVSRPSSGEVASPSSAAPAADAASPKKSPKSPLVDVLLQQIDARGPLPVAEYMRECLSHPLHGYYQQRTVFGRAGDFVTSPELSSLFGEMLAVWAMSTWERLGCPATVHLVELGPGRGTLMRDLLRAAKHLPAFNKALSVHLVETSPRLRRQQRHQMGVMRIRTSGDPPLKSAATTTSASAEAKKPEQPKRRSLSAVLATPAATSVATSPAAATPASTNTSASSTNSAKAEQQSEEDKEIEEMSHSVVQGQTLDGGVPVTWHWDLNDVPRQAPLIAIGHEFLDALPVHQFEYTKDGWREILVDRNRDGKSEHHLQFVVSPLQTIAGAFFMDTLKTAPRLGPKLVPPPSAFAAAPLRSQQPSAQPHLNLNTAATALSASTSSKGNDGPRIGDGYEVCPDALLVVEKLTQRLAAQGGACLFIDYGQDGPYLNAGGSLQAIKEHKIVDPLQEPGLCDLSAYVDFRALRRVVQSTSTSLLAQPQPSPAQQQLQQQQKTPLKSQQAAQQATQSQRVVSYPLITQRELLRELGLGPRVEELLNRPGVSEEEQKKLLAVFERLVGTESGQMGNAYRAFCFARGDLAGAPVGFAAEEHALGDATTTTTAVAQPVSTAAERAALPGVSASALDQMARSSYRGGKQQQQQQQSKTGPSSSAPGGGANPRKR